MTSLRELQAGFAAALHGEPGLISDHVVADELDAEARLRVYRNNARAMFEGALERTYPVLRSRVGEDYFGQLARDYRVRHPSRSGDLHWVGKLFACFLDETLAGTEYAWLAELAMLEWACEEALVAADAQALDVTALSGIEPDELADTVFELHPSLRCIESNTPVFDVWQANQPDAGGGPVDLSKGAQYVLVSCDEDGLRLQAVSADAIAFVRALRDGSSLSAALDVSGLQVQDLPGVLAILFPAGLVTGLRSSST